MEADVYTTPFLIQARRVWEEKLGHTLYQNSYFMATEQGVTDDIVVTTRIKNSPISDVLYGFDDESAKSIVTAMMDEKVEHLDQEALSSLARLACTISRKAVTTLTNAGQGCQVGSFR